MKQNNCDHLLWQTEYFKRSRKNRELCHGQKVWCEWKLHLRLQKKGKIFVYKAVVTSSISEGKWKTSRCREKVFFTFKWQAAIWLCNVTWNIPAEGTRNRRRYWNPGLQCKPRLGTAVFLTKWFLCKTANKYCTKASESIWKKTLFAFQKYQCHSLGHWWWWDKSDSNDSIRMTMTAAVKHTSNCKYGFIFFITLPCYWGFISYHTCVCRFLELD
jgi:hypothetical protein